MDIAELVSATRAAEILGITRRSVYDFASRLTGFPQPTRVGRTVLWNEEELRQWRRTHPGRKRIN